MRKKVLIADDDVALAKAIAIRCSELGAEPTVSPDGLHAYGVITHEPVDLLILDVNMPGASGTRMCEELARDQRFAPIPVIILTGMSDPATEKLCKELGAHYVWKGLDTWDRLQPIVSSTLGLQARTDIKALVEEQNAAPRAPKVLAIDDDPDVSKAIKIRLEAYGVDVIRAFSGMQGYWAALKEQPDVIVMDYCMPEGYGNYLLGRLQSHSLTKDIPVIVLTGHAGGHTKNCALERELFGLGASAFLEKPLDSELLLTELRRHIPVRTDMAPRRMCAAPAR